MMTLEQPLSFLSSITVEKVLAFRDAEWEARERAYHDTALEEVNSLVRKYNAMAPYAVRRGHYALNVERERAYRESAEDILAGIIERVRAGTTGRRGPSGAAADDDGGGSLHGGGDSAWGPVRLRDLLRDWFGSLMKR